LRALLGVVAVAVIGVVFTSCQSGVTMWSACSNSPGTDQFGTNGHYVLRCEGGKWNPIMTIAEYVKILQHKPVSIAPLPTEPTVPNAGCYGSSHVGHPDIYFSGQLVAQNASIFDSSDGSCGGHLTEIKTIVTAYNSADAEAACSALGDRVASYLGTSIFGLGYSGLTYMWGCA